ncbi:phytanoyl-CoA dioxygenase family protein [Geopyxis carbonaria]|nr:phytanoyl-CoA dioxygenase family protein [Geopyxis carbonaria]
MAAPSRFATPAGEASTLADFEKLCAQTTDAALYPLASTVEKNVPIYDAAKLTADPALVPAAQDEWHHILLHGPGVFVLKDFYPDVALLTKTSDIFASIIAREREGTAKGDHFSAAGHNSRIWNSFEKHALADPTSFVAYYSNPLLHAAAAAWLGPAARITAQVNIVHPGGAAQLPHRDYHLGFQPAAAAARWPLAAQVATQHLTLQGAVAHTPMPLASGPTKLLPHSQKFAAGFQHYRSADYAAFFESNYIQLPLSTGDGLFFNPALFHAAGANETQSDRSANLLQISSAFGKPMEAVDTRRVLLACWDELAKMPPGERKECAVASVAEGYPFPVDLDRAPPRSNGMAPESQAEMVARGLGEGWDRERAEREFRMR